MSNEVESVADVAKVVLAVVVGLFFAGEIISRGPFGFIEAVLRFLFNIALLIVGGFVLYVSGTWLMSKIDRSDTDSDGQSNTSVSSTQSSSKPKSKPSSTSRSANQDGTTNTAHANSDQQVETDKYGQLKE